MNVQPGTYIVAVSGGVDSVVLLHQLHAIPGLQLIVAHFDHGIRPDSALDRIFAGKLAKKYGLPFVYDTGELGPGTSEDTARQARYIFLRQTLAQQGAQAIITAHHQDDVIETAIINIIRGTSRKGLSSLGQTADIIRPFLDQPKQVLVHYAALHKLVWREDSTNTNQAYLRNYIRHTILPRLSAEGRQQFLAYLTTAAQANVQIDALLAQIIGRPANHQLNRRQFIMLPHAVARDVMADWLRAFGVAGFSRQTVERGVWAAKTFHSGQQTAMLAGVSLVINRNNLALTKPER